jgi:hypothetical protein
MTKKVEYVVQAKGGAYKYWSDWKPGILHKDVGLYHRDLLREKYSHISEYKFKLIKRTTTITERVIE